MLRHYSWNVYLISIQLKTHSDTQLNKVVGDPCKEVANVLDCNLRVSEFKLQSRYYLHFRDRQETPIETPKKPNQIESTVCRLLALRLSPWEMDTATRVQILHKPVYVSFRVDILWKVMNPSPLTKLWINILEVWDL